MLKTGLFSKTGLFFNLQLILTGSSGRETRNQLRPALGGESKKLNDLY